MECASIMCSGHPYFSNSNESRFHPSLGALVVAVNDLDDPANTPEVCADTLWPILPKVFGTNDAAHYLPEETVVGSSFWQTRFPLKEYLTRLQMDPSKWENVYGVIASYSRRKEGDGGYDFEKAVEALKIAFEVFWEEVAKGYIALGGKGDPPIPQEDYTGTQIANLAKWIDEQEPRNYNGIVSGPARFLRDYEDVA